MLAKSHKIGSQNRMAQILKKGRKFRSDMFYAQSLPNSLAYSRFSLILPSKITKTAVERNKLKRRIYSIIQKHFPKSAKTCYDVVVLSTRRAATTTFQNLEKDLISLIAIQNHE